MHSEDFNACFTSSDLFINNKMGIGDFCVLLSLSMSAFSDSIDWKEEAGNQIENSVIVDVTYCRKVRHPEAVTIR